MQRICHCGHVWGGENDNSLCYDGYGHDWDCSQTTSAPMSGTSKGSMAYTFANMHAAGEVDGEESNPVFPKWMDRALDIELDVRKKLIERAMLAAWKEIKQKNDNDIVVDVSCDNCGEKFFSLSMERFPLSGIQHNLQMCPQISEATNRHIVLCALQSVV